MKYLLISMACLTTILAGCNGNNPYSGRCKLMTADERSKEPCCNKNYECFNADEEPTEFTPMTATLSGTTPQNLDLEFKTSTFIWKRHNSKNDKTDLKDTPVNDIVRRIELKLPNRDKTSTCFAPVAHNVTMIEPKIENGNYRNPVLGYLITQEQSGPHALYSVEQQAAPRITGTWDNDANGHTHVSITSCSSDTGIREIFKNLRTYVILRDFSYLNARSPVSILALSTNSDFGSFNADGYPVWSQSGVNGFALNRSIGYNNNLLFVLQMAEGGDRGFATYCTDGGPDFVNNALSSSVCGVPVTYRGTRYGFEDLMNYTKDTFPSLHFTVY